MSQRFLQHVQTWVAKEDFKSLSPEEMKRSEDKLTPHIAEIQEEVEWIRTYLDWLIDEKKKKYKWKIDPKSALWKYPIGQCGHIRNWVMELLLSKSRDPQRKWVRAIQRYNKTQNAIVKDVWGIQNNNNFQNAIQVWGYCIDAALDTVSEPEPKVQVRRIDDCWIRNVRDFTDYANIAENYWWDEIYPNIYAPQLAGIFPAIAINDEGTIKFHSWCASVLWRNILSKWSDIPLFQDAFDFLFKSPYSLKRLPDEYVERLSKGFRRLQYDGVGRARRFCEFEEEWCQLMTEAALHQRITEAMDGTLDVYYWMVYHWIWDPINQLNLRP